MPRAKRHIHAWYTVVSDSIQINMSVIHLYGKDREMNVNREREREREVGKRKIREGKNDLTLHGTWTS